MSEKFCPQCAKLWADAKAEFEAGGSPQSPPVLCPHGYGRKPPQPPAVATAAAGMPEDLVEFGDRFVNLQLGQLKMLLDYMANAYGVHVSVSNKKGD